VCCAPKKYIDGNGATIKLPICYTNPVALVRERTIPTERPPIVGEASTNLCGQRGVAWSVRRIPHGRNLGSLDRQFATQGIKDTMHTSKHSVLICRKRNSLCIYIYIYPRMHNYQGLSVRQFSTPYRQQLFHMATAWLNTGLISTLTSPWGSCTLFIWTGHVSLRLVNVNSLAFKL
jgi:hypothetical protein